MFVSMWMTKEVRTVTPDTPLTQIAATMAQQHIRRAPVVASAQEPTRLVGMISARDVLHAFPANVNPFSYATSAAPPNGALTPSFKLTAADVMVPDPITTTPEAPIEQVAKIMREHKIGALPVLRNSALVGLITESDIFRAFVELFDQGARGVRITFDNSRGEDVLPLIADMTKKHGLRVTSFVSLLKHQRPMCVVEVIGASTDALLDDIWKSHHQVLSVLPIEGEELTLKPIAAPVFYKG